ncbi:unnamed protein product, partial [Chrysoparadoxa australica]
GRAKRALLQKHLVDKEWAAKQAESFTAWLNYVLVPRKLEEASVSETEDDILSLLIRPHCSLVHRLRAVYTMRNEAQLRYKAMKLLQSAELTTISTALQSQIERGIISLRAERVLHADVGMSAVFTDLLMSYHPAWLHMALESVMGEVASSHSFHVYVIPISSHPTRRDRQLKNFIAERVLTCPHIKQKYAPTTLVASGETEQQYNRELGQRGLLLFLQVVLLLDRARFRMLLSDVPCLFRLESEVKSSQEVLRQFCQFLKGVGDFIRDLSKVGYVVTYKQKYIDEFDFSVQNLAVELRDGVRLTRLVQVLTEDNGLMDQLRVPAVSRLQKLYNTGIAIDKLRQDGVIEAHPGVRVTDIVEGHQEHTLSLLWQIIGHYKLASLIDCKKLQWEVKRVVSLSGSSKW